MLSNRRLGRTECFGARAVPRHSRQPGATPAGQPAWQRAADRAHIARYRSSTSAADRRRASTLPAAPDDPGAARAVSGEFRAQQVATLLRHAPQSWAHTAEGGPRSLVGQTFSSRPARADRRASSSWRRYTASPRTEGRRSTWWEQAAPSWPPRAPRPSIFVARGEGIINQRVSWQLYSKTDRVEAPWPPPSLAPLLSSARTHRRSSANEWRGSVRLDIHVDAAHEDGATAVAQRAAHHAEGHAENRHCRCSGARVSGTAATRGRGCSTSSRAGAAHCIRIDLHATDAGAEHGTGRGRKALPAVCRTEYKNT
eukprot:scaffold27248_cov62-Phaeocystis_antarctica.AAC.4